MWLASPAIPLLALVGLAIHYRFGGDWWLAFTLMVAYSIIPVFDMIVGKNHRNHDEQGMKIMEQDTYYRWLTYITVPIQIAVFLAMAWYAVAHVSSWWGLILMGISAGLFNGLAINTGHELGQKTTRFERNLSKIILAVPFYGHFCIEHNSDVATPEDVASSRMGESIYRFAMREMPGALILGMECERERLRKQSRGFWSMDNQIIQSFTLSLLIYGGLVALLGWKVLPFLILNIFFDWWQFTSANYMEHYGLLREKNAKGRYESCKLHQSWSANSLCSNLTLFQLERHSDHHANPTRRYQVLRNFKGEPELPTGYFGMFMVAYIPWLWYRVMDKRVLVVPHINGDMSKVNIDPQS